MGSLKSIEIILNSIFIISVILGIACAVLSYKLYKLIKQDYENKKKGYVYRVKVFIIIVLNLFWILMITQIMIFPIIRCNF